MNRVRVVSISLVLLCLSGCGGGDEERPKASAPPATTATAPSQAEQERQGVDAAQDAIKEAMGIDASKAGLAALPVETQTALRRVAASMKDEISSFTGIAASGDPDDVSCKEWLSAPEEYTKSMASGLYDSQAVEKQSGGAARFEKRINTACIGDREGSAMDAISDAVVAAMIGEI